jgi:hypothetical protein
VDPDILGGTPVFKGTRVPVKALFESRVNHGAATLLTLAEVWKLRTATEFRQLKKVSIVRTDAWPGACRGFAG